MKPPEHGKAMMVETEFYYLPFRTNPLRKVLNLYERMVIVLWIV